MTEARPSDDSAPGAHTLRWPGLSSPALLLSLLLAPRPALELPPPPAMPARTIESSPPGERVGATARFDVFSPWLIPQLQLGRRTSDPGRFTIGGSLRFGLPISLYGYGRIGGGVAPTASVAAHRGLRDHATFGLAIGALEASPKGLYSAPYGGAALALVVEGVAPFSRSDGARLGWSLSLLAIVRGPTIGLVYTRIPLDGGAESALLLSVGYNLVGVK